MLGTAPCHSLTVPQLLRNRVLRQQKQRVASRGTELSGPLTGVNGMIIDYILLQLGLTRVYIGFWYKL